MEEAAKENGLYDLLGVFTKGAADIISAVKGNDRTGLEESQRRTAQEEQANNTNRLLIMGGIVLVVLVAVVAIFRK